MFVVVVALSRHFFRHNLELRGGHDVSADSTLLVRGGHFNADPKEAIVCVRP